MHNTRLSRKDKENLLVSYLKLREEIEHDNNPDRKYKAHPEPKKQISAWKEFMGFSPQEQYRRRQAWEDYYKKVKGSIAYEMFMDQRKQLHFIKTADRTTTDGVQTIKDAWKRFHEIAKEAHAMRVTGSHITLDIPKFPDPWEFDRGWVKAYKDLEQKIQELKQDLNTGFDEQAQEVWNE